MSLRFTLFNGRFEIRSLLWKKDVVATPAYAALKCDKVLLPVLLKLTGKYNPDGSYK